MEIVQRIFIAFDFQHLEGVGDTCLRGSSFAIFPFIRVDHLLNAGFQNSIKVISLFDEDVFPMTLICTI